MTLFMEQFPKYTRGILTVVNKEFDLDRLAEAADRIVEIQQSQFSSKQL